MSKPREALPLDIRRLLPGLDGAELVAARDELVALGLVNLNPQTGGLSLTEKGEIEYRRLKQN